ncbi:RagB/SusD family nutrient uptake outer membrane protein [Flavihumibacter cheonanensis]|uniref:RagB/SusD family nutrient uptake outer membrane protein n=1 Tax=Flavihumibacter cheonanensis TaxID=1442385 RepID=UPI001EF7A108|nr:RagB/SusD family nutrient uptake outer membrane protein [Flavihumibacter cheonanensis]MCG7754779.1 RagB/SusD family nutrient uptake outer membrane protein [Flavihumibacter cheonanensis]
MTYKKNAMRAVLVGLPILLILAGCSKFLDRKPLTATLDDLTQGGIEGQIYGLYGAIRNGDVAGQGFGGIPWLGMNNFRSDDSEKGSSPSDGADWGVIYDQFQYAKDHWSSTTYWDQHYVLIGQANTALQLADSLNANDPASLVNIAEARMFRAYAYFDLVRAFGEVPKIDFRVYNPEDSKVPKSSVAEIYALIDSDLEFARANLPVEWPAQFVGRLTQGAAQALTAKTLLYRKDWAGALSYAEQVINSGRYELFPNYQQLFTTRGENSKESIWEIQSSIGANNTDNYFSWYGIAQGVRGAAEWDLGWGWNTPTENLVNAYEAGDPRKNATILFSGQDDGLYGKTVPAFPSIPRLYWNKKVYPEPDVQLATSNRQNGWLNQPILRYADVLLMAAEAANEIGGAANEAKAVQYVNQIRARARGNNAAVLPNIAFTSKNQMRTAIQQERRVELAMEGERFYDLVRWGLAEQVLGPQGYQPRHQYYPIPQSAIDFSGGILIQNPNY